MPRGRSIAAALLSTLLAACEPAEDVRVQPLPPLERPSPEARAGLPEIAGVWRFAGWDLAPDDSASLQADLPGLGEIRLQTQRLDSLAGSYVAGGGTLPLVGEVRRDSVVSLVANAGGGAGYYLAGEVARDTLWIRLTSLVEPGAWPDDALAAFVRSEVASTFVRLHGTTPAPPVDSVALLAAAADSAARADSMALAAAPSPADSAAPALPVSPVRVPPTAFLPRPGRDAFGFTTRREAPTAPVVAEPEVLGVPIQRPDPEPEPRPAPPPPRPRPALPEPEPVEPVAEPDTQPRPMPRLLGEPVPRDTVSTRRSPPSPGDAPGG